MFFGGGSITENPEKQLSWALFQFICLNLFQANQSIKAKKYQTILQCFASVKKGKSSTIYVFLTSKDKKYCFRFAHIYQSKTLCENIDIKIVNTWSKCINIKYKNWLWCAQIGTFVNIETDNLIEKKKTLANVISIFLKSFLFPINIEQLFINFILAKLAECWKELLNFVLKYFNFEPILMIEGTILEKFMDCQLRISCIQSSFLIFFAVQYVM